MIGGNDAPCWILPAAVWWLFVSNRAGRSSWLLLGGVGECRPSVCSAVGFTPEGRLTWPTALCEPWIAGASLNLMPNESGSRGPVSGASCPVLDGRLAPQCLRGH